jgi:hypothetical protein
MTIEEIIRRKYEAQRPPYNLRTETPRKSTKTNCTTSIFISTSWPHRPKLPGLDLSHPFDGAASEKTAGASVSPSVLTYRDLAKEVVATKLHRDERKMFNFVPLLFVRDSGKLFTKFLRLPMLDWIQIAGSGEKCVATAVGDRGKTIAMLRT